MLKPAVQRPEAKAERRAFLLSILVKQQPNQIIQRHAHKLFAHAIRGHADSTAFDHGHAAQGTVMPGLRPGFA
jgi:hypothetical protein